MAHPVRRGVQLETLAVRGLSFQLYRWPGSEPPSIVLLHGWGDSGATWQFMVDHLPQRRTLLAFDARGFGRTQWVQDGYWFPDYLADLDALLERVSPDTPVDLVGHSMGGNVAMLYAGIRPQRVRRLVSLEGFGLTRTTADMAPARYRQWLDELVQGIEFLTYDSFAQFAQVLGRRHPRISADRLDFICRSWGKKRADGRIELRADPRHKLVNPVLYQREQAQACWREIVAPLLLVAGDRSEFARLVPEEFNEQQLATGFRSARVASIAGAGHMLQHEQPQAVAELVESFLR